MRVALVSFILALIGSDLVFWRRGEFKLGDRTFKVPAGFTIEPVAGPPLVDRPITAAFDEEGRLYIADSSGSNDNVQKQLAERPHRIVRLEDRDGDGRFDTRTIFADRMMFPEETMWYGGSLYVSAPPSIWRLTDTDGNGVADQRVEWFQGKTLTGCANDLHGPYLGPDGWIYWCKGAFARQTYERPAGATLEELRQTDGTLGYSANLRHGVTGQGLNDYDAIFGILAEHHYQGWVSIEDGMNGMEEMAESLAFLRRMSAIHFPG